MTSNGVYPLPAEVDFELASVQLLFFYALAGSVWRIRSLDTFASVARDSFTSRRWQTRFLALSVAILAGFAISAGFSVSLARAFNHYSIAAYPLVSDPIVVFTVCYECFAFVSGLYNFDRLACPMACTVPREWQRAVLRRQRLEFNMPFSVLPLVAGLCW